MTPESGQDRPERVSRGMHHSEVQGRRSHLPIVVQADIRHHGRPIGDQGNKECDEGIPALIGVKYPEGMDPLLLFKGGLGALGEVGGGGTHDVSEESLLR